MPFNVVTALFNIWNAADMFRIQLNKEQSLI